MSDVVCETCARDRALCSLLPAAPMYTTSKAVHSGLERMGLSMSWRQVQRLLLRLAVRIDDEKPYRWRRS